MKQQDEKRRIKELTTLTQHKKEKLKKVKTWNGVERQVFVNLPYFPPVTDKIQKILKQQHNINKLLIQRIQQLEKHLKQNQGRNPERSKIRNL
jgi:hypothetical protein